MPIDFKSPPKSATGTRKHHLECIICGNNFGSIYDETLKNFPHFHTKEHKPEYDCYDRYYSLLYNTYQYLLDQDSSTSIKQFMDEFEWGFNIHQKKLFILW